VSVLIGAPHFFVCALVSLRISTFEIPDY